LLLGRCMPYACAAGGFARAPAARPPAGRAGRRRVAGAGPPPPPPPGGPPRGAHERRRAQLRNALTPAAPVRQGLPFCVAGVGDLLALFRCISCRYCFGTNIEKPDLLGAPGRVFTTMEVWPRGGAGAAPVRLCS